jgi:hypothetical protein
MRAVRDPRKIITDLALARGRLVGVALLPGPAEPELRGPAACDPWRPGRSSCLP